MPNNIIRQDYGTVGTDVQTQMLIAPVLPTMVSDRAFNKEDRFIVNSVLYKITANNGVAINTPLIIGTNCDVSDTIFEQIMNEENYEKKQNEGRYVTLTHVAAAADFIIFQRGMLAFIAATITINAGIYNTTVTYGDYKYVSLGTISTDQIKYLYNIEGELSGTGFTIINAQCLINTCVNPGVSPAINIFNYLGSATARFQRNSLSDDTWNFIVPIYTLRKESSSSTQTITLDNAMKFFFIPHYASALLPGNVPEV